MLKKLYNVLALFAFLSVVCCVLLLCYSKTSTLTYLTETYHVANGKDTLSRITKQRVDHFWEVETEAPKASEEKIGTPAPANKTLGPCPDTPPNLFGPLRVEFDYKRTWDEVRMEVSSPLREGGRYTPPDCISKHKVGK